MRCKTCDYTLWNLKARECPECGSPFRPSDFEFTLNSVRFCCPHCGQDYYGTGEKGHLIPDRFPCVSCGQFIEMDQCVLLPTEGVADEQTKVDEMPWFERSRRGIFASWFATIGRAMVAPHRLMDSIPQGSPSGFLFGSLTTSILYGVSAVPVFIVIMAIGAGVGGNATRVVAGMAGGLGGTLLGILVGTFVFMALWIGSAHVVLNITGGTPHPIRRTSQAIGYSAGANVLSAIPCVTFYFFWLWWIWWAVAAIIMLARAQKVSGGRATLAVLAFPLLLFLGAGSLVAVAMYGAMSAAGSGMYYPSTSAATYKAPDAAAQSLARGLTGFAATNNGVWPEDPYEMVDALLVAEEDFSPLTFTPRISAAGFLPPGRKFVARRVGDHVFTYYGLDSKSSDPGLWLIIQSPAPNSPIPTAPSLRIVGLLDGTTLSFAPGEEFDAALAAQNERRAKASLPPLIDPAKVTTESPLTAESP
ncbi:hypothetical protein PHYC_03003 [Phycisphaerales bacterium]|nr:hypothetical protein PHYC_03003 [Phycisphaerales bacterium]